MRISFPCSSPRCRDHSIELRHAPIGPVFTKNQTLDRSVPCDQRIAGLFRCVARVFSPFALWTGLSRLWRDCTASGEMIDGRNFWESNMVIISWNFF